MNFALKTMNSVVKMLSCMYSQPTLIDRQKRVRQLLAVLETFEKEWNLQMPPMIVSVAGD